MPDFLITDQFTIVHFVPLTERARTWAADHIPDEAFHGPTFVAEHRYAGPIIEGIAEDGLTIA